MADALPPKPTPPAPPARPKDDDEIIERRTLRDYYIILRERVWIALPIALLVSIGLGYYQSRETPMYQSKATMQFEKPDRIVTVEGVTRPEVTSDIDINTYIEILRSNQLRARAVDSLTPDEIKILQRPFLKNLPPGTAPRPPGAAFHTPDIGSVRNSYLITITATHEDPEAAALVANKYIDQFMEYVYETKGGKDVYAVGWLTKRADELRKESEADEMNLQRYMQEQKLVSLDESVNLVNSRLQTVQGRLTETHLARLELESQLKQVETYAQEGRNLLEISAIANYEQVPALKTLLAQQKSDQANLAERYLERHPKMIDIANQISVTEERLQKSIDLAIADLKTRLEKVVDSEKILEREKLAQDNEVYRLRDLRVEYNIRKQKADVSKNSYMGILDRLSQTTTTKNLEKIPLHPLDRATNGVLVAPNMSRIIKTCSGLGILIFIGVAVGLSFIDDRIKSAWDVEHFIGVNLLGIIPDLSQIKDEEKYQIVLSNKQTPGLESFLSIYSSVKIHSKLDFPKSILITSTIPGEGKTLISCNLAGSFARHGRNTLLVDCDLRRPMLHRHFKQANNVGIISWYENGANLDSDLPSNPQLGIIKISDNLSILCSGGRSKSPSEILESPTFGQLVEKLKRCYDLVVIDSPPLGAVTDGMLIAERTDEVIYVCRFNHAYRKHIRLYMKSLRSGKNEILGVVLNGLSPRRIEYYSNYRYYRSYKKYYGAQT
jgi:capsular exopolysaccharide synthesis family protein